MKRDKNLNEHHLKYPVVGDIWHEMLIPIFRIIEVIKYKDEIIGVVHKTPHWLRPNGGERSGYTWKLDRTDPDLDNYDITRPSEEKFVSLDEFREYVSYGSIPGTWCDVYPTWLIDVKSILRDEK